MTPLRLATRSSPLARHQAETVAGLVEFAGAGPCELVFLTSRGDRELDAPIEALGGQGVFVAEIEQAVLDGRADVAVHSAKDLPSGSPAPGLTLAAVPERGDPRDALVGRRLEELAPGAMVATGSVRRRAQLAWLRPDLGFVGLRGNIGTRLEKVPDGGAAVVALVALQRLGLDAAVAQVLPVWACLPQVGQGALALRCREDDEETLRRLAAIDDGPSRRCVEAERAFLARLGGGCDLPVGAHARLGPQGEIVIEAMIASRDGHVVVRRRLCGDEPADLGRRLAQRLLGEDGGAEVLAAAGVSLP